jgi:hypothetical protein
LVGLEVVAIKEKIDFNLSAFRVQNPQNSDTILQLLETTITVVVAILENIGKSKPGILCS